jgi:hypothetical protein
MPPWQTNSSTRARAQRPVQFTTPFCGGVLRQLALVAQLTGTRVRRLLTNLRISCRPGTKAAGLVKSRGTRLVRRLENFKLLLPATTERTFRFQTHLFRASGTNECGLYPE